MTRSAQDWWRNALFVVAIVASVGVLYLTWPDPRLAYVWLARQLLLSLGAALIAGPVGTVAAVWRVFRESRRLRMLHFGAMYFLLVADLTLLLIGWWKEAWALDYGDYVLEWPLALSTVFVLCATPIGRFLRARFGVRVE